MCVKILLWGEETVMGREMTELFISDKIKGCLGNVVLVLIMLSRLVWLDHMAFP